MKIEIIKGGKQIIVFPCPICGFLLERFKSRQVGITYCPVCDAKLKVIPM